MRRSRRQPTYFQQLLRRLRHLRRKCRLKDGLHPGWIVELGVVLVDMGGDRHPRGLRMSVVGEELLDLVAAVRVFDLVLDAAIVLANFL